MRELHADLTYDGRAGVLQAPRLPGACGECCAASRCATPALAPSSIVQLSLPEGFGADVPHGQRFDARYPASLLLRAAAVLPALAAALTAGAWGGAALWPGGGDAAAAAGAFLFLSMGCIALRLYDSRSGRRRWHRRLVIVPQGRSC